MDKMKSVNGKFIYVRSQIEEMLKEKLISK